MTMIFSLHDSIAPNTVVDSEPEPRPTHRSLLLSDVRPLVRDKVALPSVSNLMSRARIDKLLERSAERFPATLICGRAGTGKTAIAALFAAAQDRVWWYTVDSTDAAWTSFSRCFASCLGEEMPIDLESGRADQAHLARFLVNLFVNAYVGPLGRSVIVMDDIHHLYESSWFDEFFNLLLYSLPAEVHLLLLCRSKPPAPLWRLRSKQMLNVLDEKIIAFEANEARELYKGLGLDARLAREACKRSFGRVSKLLELAGTASPA